MLNLHLSFQIPLFLIFELVTDVHRSLYNHDLWLVFLAMTYGKEQSITPIYNNIHLIHPDAYIIDITTLITTMLVSFQCIPTIAQRTAANNPQKILTGYPIWNAVKKTHISASKVPNHLQIKVSICSFVCLILFNYTSDGCSS